MRDTHTLTQEERHDIEHALTGSNDEGVYRNYFAAGGDQIPRLDRLVSLGFMRRGEDLPYGRYYLVMPEGAATVGLRLP